MNRGAFSLFNWTLRRDVELLRTHLVRVAFAGLMLLVLWFASLQTLTVGAAGLNLFDWICWMNILVSTLAGMSYFSTCVTEESEGGNLGLLKLAGMGSFSILLGKSTSRLVGAMMLLVVQFPFTLLAITLGGVTLIQIVSAYTAIGAHLILVANMALFFSVFSQSSGRAAVWTAAALTLFFVSPALLGFARTAFPPGQLYGMLDTAKIKSAIDSWQEMQRDLSVFDRVSAALSVGFAGPVITMQVWYSLMVSAVLFTLACLGFERSTRKQGTPQRATLSRGRRSFRRILGVSRTWENSLAWKEFYFLTGGRVMWILRAALFAGLWCVVNFYGAGDRALIGSTFVSGILIVLGIEMLIFSSRILFDESRWGTFPLLLILPISARNLVWQKTWGCLLAGLPGFAWLVVAAVMYPDEIQMVLRQSRFHIVAVDFLLIMHFTALLSLFMRWTALPAAVCIVLAFNTCCPVMSIGLILNDLMGDTGGLLLAVITFATYWILLLLPLQIEIVSRVDDAANHEYGSGG
jgi:hypothetical protein